MDGLNEKKQTFGANIHTLLSDSFFMEGFVGEFAQQKIDAVIDYLNGKPKGFIINLDQAQEIVKMIGEPIVRRYLQKEIDSQRLKKVDDNEEKIKWLEKELLKLKNDNQK